MTAADVFRWTPGLAGACAALLFSLAPCGGATVDDVRARGHLVCGVSNGQPGFSQSDARGTWSGLDVDFCAALAAAVLGDNKAVKYRTLSEGERFQALVRGDVDVLSRGTTWTMSRDSEQGVMFAGVLFYDGQGFLVRGGDGIGSALELSGTSICALADTGAQEKLKQYFDRLGMTYALVAATHWDELVRAYLDGKCTVLTADISTLALARSRLARPSDHLLLPELISKEPLGPAVRTGDDQWFAVVRWTRMALIEAEELGISRENAETMSGSAQPDVRRFLGSDGTLGQALGLHQGWTQQMVRQTGNYGELFERNLGQRSALKLKRGLNALWRDGGLMYASPFR